MNDGELFKRAILEDPDNNALRLVYADFLEESGEAVVAKRIRLHVEFVNTPTYSRADKDATRKWHSAFGKVLHCYAALARAAKKKAPKKVNVRVKKDDDGRFRVVIIDYRHHVTPIDADPEVAAHVFDRGLCTHVRCRWQYWGLFFEKVVAENPFLKTVELTTTPLTTMEQTWNGRRIVVFLCLSEKQLEEKWPGIKFTTPSGSTLGMPMVSGPENWDYPAEPGQENL